MPSLNEVHARLILKKREAREIQKAFKDELSNNPRYGQLVEQLKAMREEQAAIESQVWASSSSDAERLELLKADIKSDRELLADIAINSVADGKIVEVFDGHGTKYVPEYSVKFRKDEDGEDERRHE